MLKPYIRFFPCASNKKYNQVYLTRSCKHWRKLSLGFCEKFTKADLHVIHDFKVEFAEKNMNKSILNNLIYSNVTIQSNKAKKEKKLPVLHDLLSSLFCSNFLHDCFWQVVFWNFRILTIVKLASYHNEVILFK